MIKTENVNINGQLFTRTYSDAGYMIEREGQRYSEAIDPVSTGRTYVETTQPIEPVTEEEYAEAGRILLGVSE